MAKTKDYAALNAANVGDANGSVGIRNGCDAAPNILMCCNTCSIKFVIADSWGKGPVFFNLGNWTVLPSGRILSTR